VDYAEPMATGVMGLSIYQFESMTPADFLVALGGFMWTMERKQKTQAMWLSSIINACGHLKKGKKVRATDFYRDAHIDPRNPFYRQYLGLPT